MSCGNLARLAPSPKPVSRIGTKRGPARYSVSHRKRESRLSLSAIAINCTLKRSGAEPSSTDRMIGPLAD